MNGFNPLATGYGQDLINQIKRVADGLSSLGRKAEQPEPLSRERMEFEIFRDLLKSNEMGPGFISGELTEDGNKALISRTAKCARSARLIVTIFLDTNKKEHK